MITIANPVPTPPPASTSPSALDAAAELIAVNPGSSLMQPGPPLHCTLATLAPGASLTIEQTLRPLRPGPLIDAASVSAGQIDANRANNLAKVSTTVPRRGTAARLRIVPVEPVAKPGEVVSFVIVAAVTRPTPGVTPRACVTLPALLHLTAAPATTTDGTQVCWRMTDLVTGHPRTSRLRTRIAAAHTSGAILALHGRLTGENFA